MKQASYPTSIILPVFLNGDDDSNGSKTSITLQQFLGSSFFPISLVFLFTLHSKEAYGADLPRLCTTVVSNLTATEEKELEHVLALRGFEA